MNDTDYTALKERAAATKRLANALKAEFNVSPTSAITVGVDGRGGLRLVIIAEDLTAAEARCLIAAALAAGVGP